MTVDYEKAYRQLWRAFETSQNVKRKRLSHLMLTIYRELSGGNDRDASGRTISGKDLTLVAKQLDLFNEIAKELGWNGGGERLPRPFNHKHLERLYWQASKLLGKGGQPRRGVGREVDYADLHLFSRLGKPKRKPHARGG